MYEERRADEVLAVIPPGPEDFDFDQIDCMPVGPGVSIADDFELLVESPCPVLEINGEDSNMIFFAQSTLPLINMHIKNVNKYISVSVSLTDDMGIARVINFQSKRSVVTIDKNVTNLPINVGEGWQYLCLDLRKLCNHAFGCNFAYCTEIVVHGSCRLSKVFYTAREFSDVELPSFLRVCQKEA